MKENEIIRLIQAFIVLCKYEEKDFILCYKRLAQCVLPGGLINEGTSDPFGRNWLEMWQGGWKMEGAGLQHLLSLRAGRGGIANDFAKELYSSPSAE